MSRSGPGQRRFNRGGRGGFSFAQTSDQPLGTVHPTILKQARKSGVLNLSQRGLSSGKHLIPRYKTLGKIQEF